MSKLLKLKKWLVLSEAASYLSIFFDEEVTEADIIRFALDGNIYLSLRIVDKFLARQVPAAFVRKVFDDINGISIDDLSDIRIDNFVCSALASGHGGTDEEKYSAVTIALPGVWRIATRSAESQLNNHLQQLIGCAAAGTPESSGLILKGDSGWYCQLQEQSFLTACESSNENHQIEQATTPAVVFPENSLLVVQTTDLADFQHRFSNTKEDKQIGITERNSLLTIIAALCDYSAIKHQDRGAASQIAKLTEEIGANVSADTVKRALEKIPNALDARMK